MTRRLLSLAGAAALLVAGSAGLVAGAASAGAAVTPTTYQLDTMLNVPTNSRMVFANDHLFVTQGDLGDPDVLVFDESGNQVADLGDMPGAAGMAVSADGSIVYVALNNDSAITAIDTTTLTEIGRVTVPGCPENLAIAAGRLFFSYGCQPGQWTSAVASLDLAHPYVAPVVAVTRTFSPDLLAGGGNHLAIGANGVEPSAVSTYDAGACDGTLKLLATDTSTNGNLLDLAMTRDGSQLGAASGSPYVISEFAVGTMALTHKFAGVPYPHAVAISPDGKYFAGGFASDDDSVNLYDATTTATLWEQAATLGPQSGGRSPFGTDSVLAGSLTFSSDGSQLFGLIAAQNGGVGLFSSVTVPATTAPPTSTVPTTSAAPPTTAPPTSTAAPTTSAAPTTAAPTTAAPTTAAPTTVAPSTAAPTTTAAPQPVPGTVAPTTAPAFGLGGAVLNLIPISAAHQAKSKISVTMSDVVSHRGDVCRYRTLAGIRAAVVVTPAASRPTVSGTVQAYEKKHWVTVSTFTTRTASNGKVAVKVAKAPKGMPLRLVLKVVADSHVQASSVTSKTFEIGL